MFAGATTAKGLDLDKVKRLTADEAKAIYSGKQGTIAAHVGVVDDTAGEKVDAAFWAQLEQTGFDISHFGSTHGLAALEGSSEERC